MLELKYKQKAAYGCGLYSVANACGLDTFVTEERLNYSKEFGDRPYQLSKWLNEDGIEACIEALYFDALSTKLPEQVYGYRPKGDVIALPILIAVKFSDVSLNHMVGGRLFKDGVLYLFDSLKENAIETTLEEINKLYPIIYGLYTFVNVKTGEHYFMV